jgi:hypothetical protein
MNDYVNTWVLGLFFLFASVSPVITSAVKNADVKVAYCIQSLAMYNYATVKAHVAVID